MNYKTGENRDDSLPFTSEADLKQFYTLYVQEKLFNGETEYGTEEEKSALIDWLRQKGEAFKTYFENNILAAKPKRFIDSYNQSSLFKIFQEVWKPANS